jgi:SPP1 family phage portal protein
VKPLDDLKGRKKIYTDEKAINASNVIPVLQDALIIHASNAEQIQYLMNYEKGIQPILYRVKEVRPEINIKIVENNAAKITDFKMAYEFGSPITYIQRAKKQTPESDSDKDDVRITALNDMLLEESKASRDAELTRFFKICGVGYRMIKAKRKVTGKSVFDIITLNPLTTFIVYSNDVYQRPLMAVTYSIQKNGSTLYGCYTDDTYFEIDNGSRITNGVNNSGEYSVTNGQGVANIPSIIPIVEYVNDYDRMGCFEKVIPELDGINTVISDMANDVAQHVQNLVWMNNCELDNQTKLTTNGVIQTKSVAGVQADIKFLESRIDLTGTQSQADDLRNQAMEIAGVPQRQENSGGGSTGSAMNLSSGWQFAETMALNSESIFEQSERRSIQIMLEIIKKSTDISEEYADIVNLSISDIQIKHNRNKIYDLATKCNALATLIKAGINGKHAIETICLFTDPQATWNDSKDLINELQKILTQPKQLSGSKNPANKSIDSRSPDSSKTMQDMSDQPQKTPQSNI